MGKADFKRMVVDSMPYIADEVMWFWLENPAILKVALKHISIYKPWKTIEIGNYPCMHCLRDDMAKKYLIHDEAEKLIDKTGLSQVKSNVSLVRVSAKELLLEGEKDSYRRVPQSQIYSRAFALGLELCPAEAALQLRLQYTDQPNYEWLKIAMKPIETGDYKRSYIFQVDRGIWLDVADDNKNYHETDLWVFALRNLNKEKKYE